jgi:hypothetical protein
MYNETSICAAVSGPGGDDRDFREAVAHLKVLLKRAKPKIEQRMSLVEAYKSHLGICLTCNTKNYGGHSVASCK